MENNQQKTPTEDKKVDITMPGNMYFTNSTILASLSYLGPLIIIPFLISKDDPFVKFHLRQGIVVFLITAILWMIFNFFLLYWLHKIIQFLEFGVLILIIIGIVNALQKKEKELPLVGHFGRQIRF